MKYDHDIIRDLMPLCIDGIASDNSIKAVEEHIAECPDCRNEWKQMKDNIQPCRNITLPENTAKYTETAKRVRRHNRWNLLKLSCIITIVLFLFYMAAYYYLAGGRFTVQGVTELHFEELKCDVSDADIEYLGTLKSSDGKCAATAALAHMRDTDETVFAATAIGKDWPGFGMWSSCGGSGVPLSDTKGIQAAAGGASTYDKGRRYFEYFCFYVTDENIKNISFEHYGKSYTLSPDKNGFCGIGFESSDIQTADRTSHPIDCTVTDENGNVLQTIPLSEELSYTFGEFHEIQWDTASIS
ncbi:MAG: zf-HC2 domain-containing protein [Ruminococcus sp.]|nr:zf-HC2 domain-containing protein [Ruminococcus sp.]MBP5582320.1 zf-HC2 domain-containing protein [Ruminococcus sp.]